MAIVGTPKTFAKKFAFTVEIEQFASVEFSKCSELSAEVAKVEQWEGGRLIPYKDVGRVTFSDVTLERGRSDNDDMWVWWQQVVNAAATAGLEDPFFKRAAEILQKARNASTKYRWALENAFPTKFVAGDWDNDADENVIEMITLEFDTFNKINGG